MSDDIEAMKARVYELNRMSEEIHVERSQLESRIAELIAGFKVGQRVAWKRQGQYEITAIKAGYGFQPEYIGCKVLKAGGLGARKRLWWATYDNGVLAPSSGESK